MWLRVWGRIGACVIGLFAGVAEIGGPSAVFLEGCCRVYQAVHLLEAAAEIDQPVAFLGRRSVLKADQVDLARQLRAQCFGPRNVSAISHGANPSRLSNPHDLQRNAGSTAKVPASAN
jgi:hypothetical protein